ncbi:myogenesis-regulating glycosidase-like [Mya arenaria]|nr:myogenesis-regulating glycosidase-like [Mya arenaria]
MERRWFPLFGRVVASSSLLLLVYGVTSENVQLKYDENSRQVSFYSATPDDAWLYGHVFETYAGCQGQDIDTAATNCIPEVFSTTLNTNAYKTDCMNVNLSPSKPGIHAGVCLDVGLGLWYGGSELQYQRWPYRDLTLPWQPYVSNDIVPLNMSVGNVLERYWLSSKGVGIFIPETSPVYFKHLRKNNDTNISDELCFLGANDLNIRGFVNKPVTLDILVCKTENILLTHKLMTSEFFPRPVGQPDARMFKSPIWSTWAKFKVDIDQEKVLTYAEEIIEHGFSNSQIEIDDMFSTHYGEFDFSPAKFPKPEHMVATLKRKGFRVTVWVTPFANTDSPSFAEGMVGGYWLTDADGQAPALVKWWQGIGGTLDVENEEAVDWFVSRLEQMKRKYGVDSFKFDAGEVTYVPAFQRHMWAWPDPTRYTTKYVQAVARLGHMIEVRCGYRSQSFPVFVRMGDKESRWGWDNGLRSLVPTVLTMGILGYPYILPDMIGGNGYDYDAADGTNPFTTTELPDRELYIRWLEVTAYLPAMQFSFVPWQYDAEVVRIARKYVQIHEDVVTPIVLREAKEAQETGYPIIRPLWWLAPDDLDALECEDEFVVGDLLLVAPVVECGARTRNVYLPPGVWEDEGSGETVQGGLWLREYSVPLDHVPTFRLIKHV